MDTYVVEQQQQQQQSPASDSSATAAASSSSDQCPGGLVSMFSFYTLPSSVLGHEEHDELRAAYMFYTGAQCGCGLGNQLLGVLVPQEQTACVACSEMVDRRKLWW